MCVASLCHTCDHEITVHILEGVVFYLPDGPLLKPNYFLCRDSHDDVGIEVAITVVGIVEGRFLLVEIDLFTGSLGGHVAS